MTLINLHIEVTYQVDIIITNSPNPKLNNVTNTQTIKSFQDVFVANPNSFPVENNVFSLPKLLDYPILMLEKSSATNEFLHKLFLDNSLELVPAIELSSNDLLIDLACIGLGIAFVPDFCITDSQSNLAILNLEQKLPKRNLIVAHNNTLPFTNATQYFINHLLT